MKKIAIVVGTRPEIVKLAPVVREVGDRGVLIHTHQHYDQKMSAQFFEEFGIGEPDIVLEGVGGRNRAEQISTAMMKLDRVFAAEDFGAIVVQGDTNTVSAAAQAANYAGIPLVHVEAGLRSRDRGMPEEINRQIAGVLADAHCAPTAASVNNLLLEGVDPSRVFLTGNTIVEATMWSLAQGDPILPIEESILADSVLATIHRPENTDHREALERVLRGLIGIAAPVVLVLHPRTRAAVERHGLESLLTQITTLDPVSHRQLLAMMKISRLVISDSGGLQEECTIVKTPLLVVRRSTERPESVEAGFSVLVTPSDDLAAMANSSLDRGNELSDRPSPFGDGTASRQIAQIATGLADAARERPHSGAVVAVA